MTWLGDGTYRFSPLNANHTALNTYNAKAPVGGVETNNWTGDFNQEWALSSQGNSTFRIAPRTAWWRVLSVYETSNIAIVNYTSSDLPYWIINTASH